jgi:hypothetical protein
MRKGHIIMLYVLSLSCQVLIWLEPNAVDQKHRKSFEMWCWRRMEKISWTDRVRNEEVLLRVKEQLNTY